MKIIQTIKAAGKTMLIAALTTLPVTAQADDFDDDAEVAHNELIKAMTNIDPLTQMTVTAAPYGADGWMPIGQDYLVRFAGQTYPNAIYDSKDENTHTVDDGNEYIKSKTIGDVVYQPFVVTVQQRRDNGRVVEPVMVHFVTDNVLNSNWAGQKYYASGDIYVQSMRQIPDCTTVGHCASATWPNIYDKDYFLIHQTNDHDNIINGDYSNNLKRNEVFDALVSACACDLNADGYDEILVFVSNCLYVFDGYSYEFISATDLSNYNSSLKSGYVVESQGYGYKKTRDGNNPNTWTSVVGDIDGDGTDDVLAICNQGLYWEHQLVALGEESIDAHPASDPVISVFIPGGKGTALDGIVVNSMGSTPTLNDEHRYNMPNWELRNSDNNYQDGLINVDTYYYYHVTLSADILYPNGMYQSTQPVLAVAWKYQWSSKHPEDSDAKDFRNNMWEWSQITTYNLYDNKTRFTTNTAGSPTVSAKADIYDILTQAGAWYENGGTGLTNRNSDSYNSMVNARATLRRPALKTWYAGGRTVAPYLFYEGLALYCNPEASKPFTVAKLDVLGCDTGYSSGTDRNGRICGPVYTYIEATDEIGAITDCESIVAPVAIRELNTSGTQYKDCTYYSAKAYFTAFDTSDASKPLTANTSTSIAQAVNYNSVCHLVPYTTNTAKVELIDSYFTASNPVVKAVMAMPPYNDADIVDDSTAQISFSSSKEEGSETAKTTSTTVGGGFSMDFTLFKALKLGYSYNYEQHWDQSWGQSYTMSSENLYASSLANPKDMVLFCYIPVDCFEYKVTQSPGDPSLQGKTFTFRRALNMLNGEAHMPEVWWTVDDYNKWVGGAGVPRIDKKLLPHHIGDLNTYRRVPAFQSKEKIISHFPRKANGFYAVHDGGTAGSGDISHTLSISNGNSSSTGGGFSHTHEIRFGFENDDVPFACGVNGKYGSSDSWEATTSWTESMSVCGTIPALKDVRNAYNFYQVWYEYSDEESGQDFLVCDWAVGQNSSMPLYTDIEIVNVAQDTRSQVNYYKIQLDWCANYNDPLGKCVLEYKVDGLTPARYYTDKGTCSVFSDTDEWLTIEKSYNPDTKIWSTVDFSSDDNNSFCACEFTDYLTLNYDQQRTIREAAGRSNDVYIHYRVKVYDSNDQLVGQTEEVSTLLIKYHPYLLASHEMKVNLFKLPYGTISDDGVWSKVMHLNKVAYPYVLYGNDVNADNYADISGYDQLLLHGYPYQKYYLYINGCDATEVTLNRNGDASVDLTAIDGSIYLRGIRIAQSDVSAQGLSDDASATLVRMLGDDEGIVLSGDGLFPQEYNGYPLYDADGLQRYVMFTLLNPNALVLDGVYALGDGGMHINRTERTNDVVQGMKAESLTITDGYDFCYDYSVSCPDITYFRDNISVESQYVTAVMPFAVKINEGDNVYEYVDCDGSNVYFSTPDDGVIDAYTPIIINVKSDTQFSLSGENLVALSPNGIFNITPAPSTMHEMLYGYVTKRREGTSVEDNEEIRGYNVYGYSLLSHQFVRVTDTFAISPFRAFFLLPKSAPSNLYAAPAYTPSALNIVINGKDINDTSGIDNVTVGSGSSDGATYNLLGIPVGSDYRGVVIRSGKKIIRK